ncbi:MAG: hypothetical protein AAFV98_13750 [Chloroflexota bacterium]
MLLTQHRYTLITHSLVILLGVLILFSGIEAQLLLNRIADEHEVTWAQLRDQEPCCPNLDVAWGIYYRETHSYYYGYENYNQRFDDGIPRNHLRAFRGDVTYFAGLCLLPIWYLAYFVTAVMMWQLVRPAQKTKAKHSRTLLSVRAWFVCGMLIALSLPFFYSAMYAIAYITD